MIEVVALGLSIATFLGGVYAYWRSQLIARVNAERDLKHVRGNLENLSKNLNLLLKDAEDANEAVLNELREIKALSLAQGQRIEFLRERLMTGNSASFGSWGNQ